MKLRKRTITVISMTNEEASRFLMLVEEAVNGKTVHYAETQLTQGGNLGVQIDPNADRPDFLDRPMPPESGKQNRY